ncbi:hypothetical protein AC629_22920 [Bradyrhizobium sp. NAS80.1]|nr:hypothetical protein AC629_22920 [Bradyrhizobium sp. NAS80.1]
MTPQEAAMATVDATCKGCGQRMRLNEAFGRKIIACSDRCAQRERRQRHRQRSRAVCICGIRFVPKRRDAKFCSAACKQKAYRRVLKDVAARLA